MYATAKQIVHRASSSLPFSFSWFVADLAKRHANSFIAHTESLYSAACILARGAHRVAVLDDVGHVVNIISQSSIISFLAKHSNDLRTELSVQIDTAGLGVRPVVSVSETDNALQVFRLMAHRNLSGVPIVNGDGSWVGNISGSDLKLYVRQPCYELLQQPIASFLAAVRSDDLQVRR